VDLDEVNNDVATAAALARTPGRRQGRKSRRSAMEELGNNQSVEQSAAAISTISGAISGFIEAKRQKMSQASGAHTQALAEAEVHPIQFAAYEIVCKSMPKEDRGELDSVKDLGFIGSWRHEQTIELTRARLIYVLA
jgi:hypothetical protein